MRNDTDDHRNHLVMCVYLVRAGDIHTAGLYGLEDEMTEYLCPRCGSSYYGSHVCNGKGNWAWINADEVDELRAELARLTAELEQERVKLAGCLCAAEGTGEIAYTGDYGWSPAYQATRELRKLYEKTATELARRDEKIAELQFQLDSLCPCEANPQDEHYLLVDEMCPIHGHPYHETDRRDEIIKRLKEDGERLYTSLENFAIYDDFVAIILHRALMKELGE